MELRIQENVPLAPLTTLKIGGPARFFVRAESEEAVAAALSYAEGKDLDVFVLGGGSNVLVSDKGFNGLVVQIAIRGISGATEEGEITAGAGEDWDGFAGHCIERDLAGVECLSGIPGSVGGTPVQNVGAYGQEVSETIESVRCFDRAERKITILSNGDCGFTYRKSIFNSTEQERYVVLSVTYKLTPGGEPKIVYRDLIQYFEGRKPTLAETRDAVLEIRRAKSMVIDENDPNSCSAGSFFKNPIVDREFLNGAGAGAPYYDVDEKHVKIPAAWLIENSGIHKGDRFGNAGISSRHSLALVNFGGATAEEILELKQRVQDAVLANFGVTLQPEPIFVGF